MSIRPPWTLDFRSVADLDAALRSVLPRLPSEFDLVAGVPRSGMLPASLLALYLNRPMTDVEGLLEGRVMGAGIRAGGESLTVFPDDGSRILVVDDSVGKGVQMRETKARLAHLTDRFDLTYLAVYVTPEQRDLVDIAVEILPGRRCFAWNIMHHPVLASACIEFEGVLADVPGGGAEDGTVSAAPPRFIPRVDVGWVLSQQPEARRADVEEWLLRHGVAFRGLLLRSEPEAGWVRETARLYGKCGANLLISSDPVSAPEIAHHSRMPVLCISTGTMHEPSAIRQVPVALRRAPRALWRRASDRSSAT